MLGTFTRHWRRRRFRHEVKKLIDPLFSVNDRELALANQYEPAVVDEMCDRGDTVQQSAIYLLSALLTRFIAESVDETRRAGILTQLQRYAEAAVKGEGATALPKDDLALLVLFAEDQANQWSKTGLATAVDAEILISELIGALRGIAPQDRTMGRFMDFLGTHNLLPNIDDVSRESPDPAT